MMNPRDVRATRRQDVSEFRSREWIDNEEVGCEFEDVGHGKRLWQLLEQFSGRVGSTSLERWELIEGLCGTRTRGLLRTEQGFSMHIGRDATHC